MTRTAEAYRAKVAAEERFVMVGEGRYRMYAPECGVSLDLDRLRRDGGALWGELMVRCDLPGASTHDGVLSAGDLNLSSVQARETRAKFLATRAHAPDVDFVGLLEEFAQRVIEQERKGAPAVLLRDLPRPSGDDVFEVDGVPLLRRHPVMLFGDGGSAKSYLGLYLAGRVAQLGQNVGLFDWELAGEDHRDRLELLFGEDMPGVIYARCSRPLVHEVDRLRRIVQDQRLDFVVFDSVAFACDGPPEAAEVAGRYGQSLRQLGTLGSLHIAHVSKQEGADMKPFGSVFWHNMARATWNVKLAEGLPGSGVVSIALHNRKANLGPTRPSVGYEITFEGDRTVFRRADVAAMPELAVGLSARQRIAHALRAGALSIPDLARELDSKQDTVEKAVKRGLGKVFTFVPGPDGVRRVGLLGRAS